MVCILSVTKPLVTNRILILNSYDEGFEFGYDTIKSLKSTIYEQVPDVSIGVHYMDTHQYPEDVAWPLMYETLKLKYKKTKPTLIVAMDNSALNFLLKHGDELFGEIPVVFSGINFFDPAMLKGHENHITGVTEDFSFRSLARTILHIHPDVERVVFLHDNTLTGHLIGKKTEEIDPIFKNADVKIEHLIEYKFSDLTKLLRNLNKNSIVLISSIHRDIDNVTLGSSNAEVQYLKENIPKYVPVYSYWGEIYNELLLGGEMLDATLYGIQIGQKVAQIIIVGNIKKSPVEPPIIKKIFFYDKMIDFGIKEKRLPSDVTIVGKNEIGNVFGSSAFKILAGATIIQVMLFIFFFMRKRT